MLSLFGTCLSYAIMECCITASVKTINHIRLARDNNMAGGWTEEAREEGRVHIVHVVLPEIFFATISL